MLTRIVIAAFLVVTLTGSAALAQEAISAEVNAETQKITLASHGTTYEVMLGQKTVMIKITDWSQTPRFSLAENTGGTEWMHVSFVKAEVTKDTDDEKEVQAVLTPVWQNDEPGPKTRRGMARAAGEEAPEVKARVILTLGVCKDTPGLRVQYKVVNDGPQFRCYLLPWLSGGTTYVIDGPNGREEKKFIRKYGVVSEGKIGWLFQHDGDQPGLGTVFLEPEEVFVGEYGSKNSAIGTIYLNALPRQQTLATGEDMEISVILMMAKSADEVAAVAKKVQQAEGGK